jgi:site-specific recombinase XerC
MKAGTVRPKGSSAYKPNTVRSYERAHNNYIGPSALGGLKVADVRRADVQPLADELLAAGLSAGTVSNVLNPIQALYRRLIDRDLIAFNPATRIDLPCQGRARAKRIASGPEAARLLAVLPDEDRPLWAMAFYAGLRRGEVQAIRVCEVDLGAADQGRARLGSGGGCDRGALEDPDHLRRLWAPSARLA